MNAKFLLALLATAMPVAGHAQSTVINVGQDQTQDQAQGQTQDQMQTSGDPMSGSTGIGGSQSQIGDQVQSSAQNQDTSVSTTTSSNAGASQGQNQTALGGAGGIGEGGQGGSGGAGGTGTGGNSDASSSVNISGQTATGGNSSANGGNASATGGNSSASGGTSSANGGSSAASIEGQNATGGTANVNVEGSTYNSNTVVNHRKIPVSTSYAPGLTSGIDTCLGSFSAGGQTSVLGLSLGSTKTDKVCQLIKLGREAGLMGMADVQCRLLAQDERFRKALEASSRSCDMPTPVAAAAPAAGPAIMATPATAPQVVCESGPFAVDFDWDSAAITSAALSVLDRVVEQYKACPKTEVLLTAHADRSGSNDYNIAISNRRLDAVRGYLMGRGIPDVALIGSALGEDAPSVRTPDGARHRGNRSVEIRFSPDLVRAALNAAPTAVAAAPRRDPEVRRIPVAGEWRVQLGAFRQASGADRMWQSVSTRPVLTGYAKSVSRVGELTILAADGFGSKREAQEACDTLTQNGVTCYVSKG